MEVLLSDFDQGRAAQRAGRLDEAQAFYERMLASEPSHAEALHQLGTLHVSRGSLEEGVRLFVQSLQFAPAEAETQNNLGRALFLQGRHAEATILLNSALALNPRLPEIHKNLGDALKAQDDFTGAVAAYLNALNLQPNLHAARRELAIALFAKMDFAATVAVCRDVLSNTPDDPEILCRLGFSLAEVGRYDEALIPAERALALAPNTTEPHVVIGSLHLRAGRLDEASACFRRGLVFTPAHQSALNHLAAALLARNRVTEAVEVYREACALHPGSDNLRYNCSFAELAAGDFEAGWESYERRWVVGAGKANRVLPVPMWEGEAPLHGRTLLLHCEQGLGDTIQFGRYAALAAAQGATVFLVVQTPLRPLFATLPYLHGLFVPGETVPAFDLHCPLLSAPRAFRTRLETIPADVPYLSAPAEKKAVWRERLRGNRNVGIVWSGNPSHRHDHLRSIPLADFASITRDTPFRFFSLQKEIRPADAPILRSLAHIENLSDRLEDFGDTAAAMSSLDLVITVDTATAHLAGALGVRVWVLLAYAADWRWLVDRTDSPWYPTMRLFRQHTPGVWTRTLTEVRDALLCSYPPRSITKFGNNRTC